MVLSFRGPRRTTALRGPRRTTSASGMGTFLQPSFQESVADDRLRKKLCSRAEPNPRSAKSTHRETSYRRGKQWLSRTLSRIGFHVFICLVSSRIALAIEPGEHDCVSIGTCERSLTATDAIVDAVWFWDVQLTRETFDQAGSVPLPMPHYACTNRPDQPFCPGCKAHAGFDCFLGRNCHTCLDLCEPFDFGGNTFLKEDGKCSSNSDLRVEHLFEAQCLPRLQVSEGRFSPLGTYFHHFNSSSSLILNPEQATHLVDELTVHVAVKWGYLDVFNLWPNCASAVKEPGSSCTLGPAEVPWLPVRRIKWTTRGRLLQEDRAIAITGTFQQLKAAMLNMSFSPIDYYNSLRVRHYQLSPLSTQIQPWFEVSYRLSNDMGEDNDRSAIFKQLIEVFSKNDPPRLSDPQQGYLRGCITKTPCGNVFSSYETDGPNFYFGQFWVWEGSLQQLAISGLEASDPDVDERCLFSSSKPCPFLLDPVQAFRCGNLDFSVISQVGKLALNTRDDISLYRMEDSALGLLARERHLSTAIRVLYYFVDHSDAINSGVSKALFSNTQHVGAKDEYLFIRLSDQGFTGSNGFSEVAVDRLGSPGLRINITIAAKNDPPTVKLRSDFSAVEDVPMHVDGLEVQDVDADEVITSDMAKASWLNLRSNQNYLNRLRITAQLNGFGNRKGRGLLFLGSDARQLSIISNGCTTFLTVASFFPGHDSCYVSQAIRQPGIFKCNAKSVPSKVTKICRGVWDDTTCETVAEGLVLSSNDNGSMIVSFEERQEILQQIVGKPDDYLVEMLNGSALGKSASIQHFSKSGMMTLSVAFDTTPEVRSRLAVRRADRLGTCEYAGTSYHDVCDWEESDQANTQDSECRVAAPYCDAAEKDTCACKISNTCETDGMFLLYLNRSKPASGDYINELLMNMDGIGDGGLKMNKTCGGLPVRRLKSGGQFPEMLGTSLGKPCTSSNECSRSEFRKCTPGVDCFCCGNLTAGPCSSNSDCEHIQSDMDKTQICGCQMGMELDAEIHFGKRCCSNLSVACSGDSDCHTIQKGSFCGCLPGYPICGPFLPPGVRYGNGVDENLLLGRPCLFRGVELKDFPTSEFGIYGSEMCESPMWFSEGTTKSTILQNLVFPKASIGEDKQHGLGSTRIEFHASRRFASLALKDMKYLTHNPNYPFYNRLYRLPEGERDPVTFKIDANDYDVISLTVDDMGNSGGALQDKKVVEAASPIIVAAVNNPPELHGPAAITVLEDTPFSIIYDKQSGETDGVYITDADEANFGFNEPRIVLGKSHGFMVNLTVEHGCLFLNEHFLRYGPEYAGRVKNVAKIGGPDCSLQASFDLNGCTIRLKDFGQPRNGIHATRCLDSLCTEFVMDPCFSDVLVGRKSAEHCYGRHCAKFIAIEGRFSDINSALSNITYLNDPDFNTFYGYSEHLRVDVADNGIIGDAPVTSFTHSLEISITVLPSNDPPVIGKLHHAACTELLDDGTYDLADIKETERLFTINPSVDFVDVDEDTIITLMPDRVWIADVDAEEAFIRSEYVAKCADICGSVAAVGGCCLESRCPKLCEKIKKSFIGALPSEILVEFRVSHGLISFVPPPTRPLVPGLTALTNMSVADIKVGGEVQLCPDQLWCVQNQSRIWLRGRVPSIQEALRSGFLTYVGHRHYHGNDRLQIWVSDDGYSDSLYKTPRSAIGEVPLMIVAVNDKPEIFYPGGSGCTCDETTGICSCMSTPPLSYSTSLGCFNDWVKFSFSDPWPSGSALDCPSPMESSIPNAIGVPDVYQNLNRGVHISDADINDTPHGNITVEIQIGRPNVGDFQLKNILWTVTYYQWEDTAQMTHVRLKGRLVDVNQQVKELFFNIGDYSGPSPLLISASDNNNYGVCKPKLNVGEYKCDRSFCKNIFSGSLFVDLFLCNKPVVSPTIPYEFLPGSSIACTDIRLQGQEQIQLNAGASASGPFSCLGCGYYNPASRQVSGTSENNPSEPGFSRATVDVIIRATSACSFKNCTECNAAPKAAAAPYGDGCGWCPAFCGGDGKCMIGKSSPLFEKCPADPASGLIFRQCRVDSSFSAIIVATVVLSIIVTTFLAYSFWRWTQRRHGSLSTYWKKRRFDTIYAGRQLQIVPPEGASYRQFFILILTTCFLVLLISGAFTSDGGRFDFQSEFYLDSLDSVAMDLDNCNLRFLPTRNYPFPTNRIAAIKVRFSYTVDPEVRLISDTCSPASYFKMQNTRSAAEKYSGYFCSIEVLLPDRIVVPTTSINAIGHNLTTVRAGPMDDDTPNFGLEFGANEFCMTGENIEARIGNISAKHIKYDVNHGSLVATDITFTPFATFNSISADITVTSDKPTSVHYWQKSDNLACISAATVYLDEPCSTKCSFAPLKDDPFVSSDHVENGDDVRLFDRHYRRAYVKAVNGSHFAREKAAKDAIFGRAKARRVGTCDAVDNMAGCIDHKTCEVVDTAFCRCKNSCDSIPPADLDFDGFSGIQGTCNEAGKCCRRICSGYAQADLFPEAHSVRCGICQPQDLCSPPTCGAWTPANLEQQWWFTSQTGQISISVQSSNLAGESSLLQTFFKGEEGQSDAPDFSHTAKKITNSAFHPGGADFPDEDWFWLRLTGPGAPAPNFGSFAWLKTIRFLVLPSYFLQVASYGLLSPKRGEQSLQLRPGFCPTILKNSKMDARVMYLQQILSDTLQFFPSDRPSKLLPHASKIAWIPVQGPPAVFKLDASTNKVSFVTVALWSGMGSPTIVLVFLTVMISLASAATLLAAAALAFRNHLSCLRWSKIQQENTSVSISEEAHTAKIQQQDGHGNSEVRDDVVREMIARTSFFYVLETHIWAVERQKTIFEEFVVVCVALGIVFSPIAYVSYLATYWKISRFSYLCEARIDQGACYAETEIVSTVVFWICVPVALVEAAEFGAVLLQLPSTNFTRALRTWFYCSFCLMIWLASALLFFNILWIFTSALHLPSRLGPYAIAALGILLNLLRFHSQLRRFQARVGFYSRKRLEVLICRLANKYPTKVLAILVENNIHDAMRANGLSSSRILLQDFIFVIIQVVSYSFVFTGIQAFANTSTLLELFIVFACSVVIMHLAGVGSNRFWTEDELRVMTDDVMVSVSRVVQTMQRQVQVASLFLQDFNKSAMILSEDSSFSIGTDLHAKTF